MNQDKKILLGWDLGNVLLPFSKEKYLQNLLPEKFEEAQKLEISLEKGEISSEFFYSSLQKISRSGLSFQDILDGFTQIFSRNKRMENLLEEVFNAKTCVNILLSNTNAPHWQEVEKQIGHLLPCFEEIVLSHLCGFRKPDKEFFLSSSCVSSRESTFVFIDDLEVNLEGARLCGAKTILFCQESELRKKLCELGVLKSSQSH